MPTISSILRSADPHLPHNGSVIEILDLVLSRPIAFYRFFADIGGGAMPGLFLSQTWYWSQRTTDEDGWFYKTQDEWQEETALTRREQETCRRTLKLLGILEEERRGIPARLYYRINVDKVAELVHSRMAESANQECPNPPNRNGGKRQSISEITSETTPEKEEPPYSPPKGTARMRNNVDDVEYTMGFLAWWQEYPVDRRLDKVQCFQVWKAHALESRTVELVDKLKRLNATTWHTTERKHVKTSLPYLHSQRYEDDPMPWPTMKVVI